MKSYKQLLNEWSQNATCLHEMTDTERGQVQRKLVEMFLDIQQLCDRNGLTVMLGGGSCLGAIRHKGFIPWDDDLDLNMLRADYNRLISLLCQGKLGDKYEFRYPDGKMYSSSAFLKIYLKKSIFSSIGDDNALYPHGLFIDIFPIEGTPSFALLRRMKGFIANSLRLIGNCVMEKQFESQLFKKAIADVPELKNFVGKRHVIGTLFSFLDYRTWMYLFDHFVSDSRITPLVTVPTGRNLYNGEIIKSSDLLPTIEVPFESISAKVYGNYHAYLSMMYGNYMVVPPIEKRERHFICEFKL